MKLLGGISGLYSFFSYSINDMLDICLVAAWQFSSGHRLWNTIASMEHQEPESDHKKGEVLHLIISFS